jgi:hypothetical protein
MIPDFFFEDPFVYNVPIDDLVDCYVNEDLLHVFPISLVKKNKEDLERNVVFYSRLIETYMRVNLQGKGEFLVVHDGKTIVKACEEDGSVKSFFQDRGLDFSHLKGMRKEDLQILIIPCSMLEDPEDLRERLSGSLTAEIWSDGEISQQ